MVAAEVWLRFVSGPDIAALAISDADVIGAVERVVADHGRGLTVFEPRTHLVPDNSGRGHFNVLRGHVATLGERGVSAVKVVGDFVDNYRYGLPSEMALITLYDPMTGRPLAILDATEITARRTGAMTAVGAKYLARPDAKILGHVGARGTAFANVTMLDGLFDFDEIRVTSKRVRSREAFADQLRTAISTPVRVVDTADEAFEDADILVEASRLLEPEPLVHTSVVKAGAFVVPYGTVSAVELDLLDVMDKVVVDDWREAQAGQFGSLRRHVQTGRLSEQTLYAQFGEIVAGLKAGRERSDERILLWHRGLSILDIAVATMMLAKADQTEVGTMLRYR
jgi:alanine dehydrogenase